MPKKINKLLRLSGIYKIENKITNDVYIGSAVHMVCRGQQLSCAGWRLKLAG